MNRNLTNTDSDSSSAEALAALYDHRRVPAEKKPFLIALRESFGPVMAIEGGAGILDVASQIASMAIGFNPGVAFGAAQLLESWTGRTDTAPIKAVRLAYKNLLARQLGWPDLNVHFCQSGAEANETALGLCYQRRGRAAARNVVAFKNSFHGRMSVSLACTWNPAKREPFARPDCQVGFVDYPEMPDGDDVRAARIPATWRELWASAPRVDFVESVQDRFGTDDPLLQQEISCLLHLRELLRAGEYFAVIIEPMQCEGGDRYATARFHNGLVNLCRAFDVPLIYDEIQTGFGLGGDFFWHQKFDLRNSRGEPTWPDYVVIAKKAQVGAVLAHTTFPFDEEYNSASMARGFIQASMIEQFRPALDAIEDRTREELGSLIRQFQPAIERPRVSGLSFAFDFADPAMLKRFVSQRFHHGLLYYPAGDRAARFRFNMAFRGRWQDLAWTQIRAALAATLDNESTHEPAAVVVDAGSVSDYYPFQEQFLKRKLADVSQSTTELDEEAIQFVQESIAQSNCGELQFHVLDQQSYPEFRDRIEALQSEIYEPLRQTPIEKFDRLIEAKNSLAIVVSRDDRIVAMAFAAPPENFPRERGLREDRLFDDPRTLYMLDLTVIPEYQGRLGRAMKQGICLIAQQRGMASIIGRNRDRLARGMWAINLSLGSYCTRIIREDYMDEHEHRDCLVYRCDLEWEVPHLDLSGGVQRPMTFHDLTTDFVRQNMPALVNKLTLSNFVTPDYLENLQFVFSLLPESLQHGYTASGISECVDKLVKTIWLKRKPRTRMVTITDSWFGNGSFLARSLSGTGEPYFDVHQLKLESPDKIVQELEQVLAVGDILAAFVEPLGWMNGRRLEPEVLLAIRDVCQRYQTPLVSHDSGGLFYRYSEERFGPSGCRGFMPDAGMISLGGQMALCYMDEAWFVDTPLMFISTWDGDAFSLAQFAAIARRTLGERQAHESLIDHFHEQLLSKLVQNGVSNYDLNRGSGWFSGPVEISLAQMFRSTGDGRHVCLPSPGAMRRFVESTG